ncbi:hypothetical protein [Mycetocola sp.]|uniref:hypothetical protein n=1 Tax=Mycetocola sp. TaxID=1871042 RepID=UPI003989F984
MTAVLLHPSFARRAARGIRRAFVVALLTCLAITGLIVSDPSAARADDTIGISGVPAGADGNADNRSRFSYSADPGQQVTDNYLVRNTGTLVQSFTILATDAFNDDEGAYALLETGAVAKDVGTWVRFENGMDRLQFDLKSGESRVVPFTVDIPAQAGPGDHAGGILASVVTPGEQVNVDRRLGTRLYVRVSGDIQAGLTIGGVGSQYVGDWWNPFAGAVRMSYTVENTGNIVLASNISVGARTWFGIPAGGEQGDGIPELLPGSTRTFETDLPGIASVGYLNPWVTLNPFVEGDDETKRMPVPATTRDTVLIAPPWILVIALVLVALFFVYRRWRRQVDAKRAAVWIEYTENEARRKVEAEQAVQANDVVSVGTGGSGS